MRLHIDVEIGEGARGIHDLAMLFKRTLHSIFSLMQLGKPVVGNPHPLIDRNGKKIGSWAFIDESRTVYGSERLWLLNYPDPEDSSYVYATGPYPAAEAERMADDLGSLVADEISYRHMLAENMFTPVSGRATPLPSSTVLQVTAA
jgi:hypothetical protein